MVSFAPILRVLISAGDDVNTPFRDIAQNCLRLTEQMFSEELDATFAIVDWDYRDAAPGVVPGGELFAKSVRVAARADVIAAILGAGVSDGTREEIRKGASRIAEGETLDLLTFCRPSTKGADHDALVSGVLDDFGYQIIYTPFEDELEFQGRFLLALIPCVLRRLEWKPPVTELTA